MKGKKIGIYSPYIDIFGGGERYILTIAQYLSQENEVYIFWDESEILKNKVKSVLNISLDRVHFISPDLFQSKNPANIIKNLISFNVFFHMTDGSIFISPAQKNFLIIESPLHCPKRSLINAIKLTNWQILCYSEFMKEIIKNKTKREAIILPPPVDVEKVPELQKENRIINVGRFFTGLHNKKQDVLISEFLDGKNSVYKGYTLTLVGGLTEDSGNLYLQSLMEKAKGERIEININIPYKELLGLYERSKVYWHAAGFGENLDTEPEKAEHFGITTVEAMGQGCVPIVYAGGGQREIIQNEEDGYLWSTLAELREKTNIILTNETKRALMSQKAQEKARNYSKGSFHEKLDAILSK